MKLIKKTTKNGRTIYNIFGLKIKIKGKKQVNILKKYKKRHIDYSSSEIGKKHHAIINLVGDLMCETFCQRVSVYGDEYFFKDSFYFVRNVLSNADLVVGNLETIVSEGYPYMGQQNIIDGHYNCNSPVEFLDALKYAGFGFLVTANNHNLDVGKKGILDTIHHLNEYGFRHTGMFENANDKKYAVVEVNDIRIGILSYTTIFNNVKTDMNEDDLALHLNKYSLDKLKSDIKSLRQEGVDFIIAYNHWGIERINHATKAQKDLALEMANLGVDYIIGSHPHALQPYDILTTSDNRKVPVVYSMGNFLSSSELGECTRETIILQLKLDKKDNVCKIASQKYIPCKIFNYFEGKSYPIIPLDTKYNGGISSKELKVCKKKIKRIMGKLINSD